MDPYPFGEAGVSIDLGGGDRFPQWSMQETRQFLIIRAELDPTFMETKRNKLLWELISNQMKEKGYNRSPDQCKCKWKNLVTRYKGCETREAEWMRQQFPFYNEMQAIFNARMQRMLWMEAESGAATAGSSSRKKAAVQYSSEEEDEINDDSGGGKKKRKMKMKMKMNEATNPHSGNLNIVDGVREMMDEFMKQQMETEMQ
ncbi:hypothetical protein CDL12_09755 [Handroanthus impetiginosus]|uniref:Myb-like domain-containing protein n=1 Tax=Handroanthus impetiginosus TaxID=429701 RepID=A0A2G9HJ93_9LAMI|nr:hypothetical protein CDL12_09755 [Handroanthus impetiginosus]